jgi:hypothetical protein
VPVVRREEIELEVLGGLVLHMLAIDHHPQRQVPLRDLQVGHEPRDVGGERLPARAGLGQLLERQPAPVPDLDGIGAAASGQELETGALAEGGVHAELHGERAAQARPQAVEELPEEGHGLLGVVDVARPVLEPQDVPGLGEMGDQRVVGRVLPVMGVEPAERPGDRRAGADDRAVDIDGEPRQLEPRDGLGDQVLVELHQRLQPLLGEALEPVADGPGVGTCAKPQNRVMSGSPAR